MSDPSGIGIAQTARNKLDGAALGDHPVSWRKTTEKGLMTMDDARKTAEGLARTPLEKTNLSSRLIRSLTRAGHKTLESAFDTDESEIEKVVGKSFSEFTMLVDAYYEKPEHFVELMSREKKPQTEKRTAALAHQEPPSAPPHTKANGISRDRRFNYVSESALDTQYGQFLKTNQKKAESVFDDLCDRHESVLVYQTFPSFSVELGEIRESFLKLFDRYTVHPGKALDVSRQFLPDLFLIFIADLARDSFADDNLWGNFSKTLPLSETVLGELKRLFVHLLRKRNMPIYAQDETVNCYFYTALLHGGLSKDSWDDLWKSSLIPLAKDFRSGWLKYRDELSGRAILKELQNENSRYAPKKESVARILEKASTSTIAPLFEAALEAAMETNVKILSGDEYILVNNYGLPEVAVSALCDTYERQLGQRTSRGHKDRRKYASLPHADLCLDLERGTVLIKWTKKHYPPAFLGDRIDFYMDGKKLHEQHFETRLGQCILDDVEIEASPQMRYDVELRLMKRAENGFEQKGSLEQTFLRSKPGCFEFIQGIDGTFHLRNRNDRIVRRRRIAYVVKDGYFIDPGAGMTPVSKYETGQAWSGRSAFIFDVDPGASGSILKTLPEGGYEEVAVWQESYRARIDKRSIIGETDDGLDLYGYIPCKNGDNAGLPRITIEAAGGESALRDLDISCTCDGERFSVPRELVWSDSCGDSAASQIALPLERASTIASHAEKVEVIAKQVSSGGKTVFRYRFAIVPIQEFRLQEAHMENGIMVARYGFLPKAELEITDADGIKSMAVPYEYYSKKTLLKDEFLPLAIASEDGEIRVRAKLALSAIDIVVPDELALLSRKRPLCLSDAMAMGTSGGEILIRAHGWRYNRMLYVHAGLTPLVCKELKRPTEISFNLFASPTMFVPGSGEPRDIDTILSIGYGDRNDCATEKTAWTDAEILRCREGIGFKDCLLCNDGRNTLMRFDKPTLCDAEVLFRQTGQRPKDLETEFLPKGSTEIVVPPDAARAIRTRKNISAIFAPKARMGKARFEYSFETPLEVKHV